MTLPTRNPVGRLTALAEGHRRPLLAILAVSVALRLAACAFFGDDVRPDPGVYDQLSYHVLAVRVVDGQGFSFPQDWWPATRAGEPTAHWSFLYTGLVALFYALLGPHPLAVRLVQALVIGVLLPLGLYRLGRATLGERTGLWAAAWSAVYVYFVYYSAALMTEMATIVAVVWSLVIWIEQAERPTRRGWVMLGGLIGVAALLRQVTLLAVPPLALWLLARHRPRRSTLAGLAASAAVVVAIMLPVTWRNYHVFHRWVPLNTNAGYAFFFANHPVHGTEFHDILPDDGPSYNDLIPAELRGLDEAALNDALMGLGWGFVRADPLRYLALSLSRLEDLFRFWPSAKSGLVSNVSRVLSFGLALPFMLLGLVWSRRSWRRCLPLYLFAGTYVLIHLLSWSLIRYRLPVDAIMLIFGAYAVGQIADKLGAHSPQAVSRDGD